jgi:hypothetical protein
LLHDSVPPSSAIYLYDIFTRAGVDHHAFAVRDFVDHALYGRISFLRLITRRFAYK